MQWTVAFISGSCVIFALTQVWFYRATNDLKNYETAKDKARVWSSENSSENLANNYDEEDDFFKRSV